MEVGTIVKIHIPYGRGEKRIVRPEGERYKVGKVVGVYSNFINVKFKGGYIESYRKEELIDAEGEEYGYIYDKGERKN